MSGSFENVRFLEFIVDRVNIGVFVVDPDMNVLLWNHFMEVNSGRQQADVIGKNLFEQFPDLPQKWLEKKIRSVFVIKNFAFTGWEQRPHLFKFRHNRPVTGGVDFMLQNCTFLPIKDDDGEIRAVCITVMDVTDSGIYQKMMKDAMGRLEEMSIKDGLTGIYNRRYLEEHLEAEVERAQRYENRLSVLLFDLDHFKSINDTYGHQAGDEVLRSVAQTFQSVLRGTDIAGRYGGEEFTIILPNTDIKGAAALADRIREKIEQSPIKDKDQIIPITVSIGVSCVSESTPNHEALLHQADLALYRAKETGRNRVEVYDAATY